MVGGITVLMISGKPTRELSVGEILSSTFNLYLSNFIQFFLPFLIAGIIMGLSNYAITSFFTLPPAPSPRASEEELLSWIIDFLSTFIIMMALLFLVSWIVGTITAGTVVKYASDQIEQKSSSLSISFKYAMSKFPSLLIAQFIVGLLVVVGLFLFIIGGIIVAIVFSLTFPAVIIEQRGVFESLSRSKKLVSNRWMKIFALMLILGIITVIVGVVASVSTIPLNTIHPIVGSLVSSIISAFISPIFPIATVYLYYAMVAREIPPPPPPPTF
ncbi:MAG: hypothetical protein QXI91_06095 [Candidatus Bathyarchaeia archaeon]